MNFEINHKKKITEYPEPFLRKSKLLAFLYSLVKPLETFQDTFLIDRQRLIDEAYYNSQQMLIEHILNKNFDPDLEEIEVFTPDYDSIGVDAYLEGEGPGVDAYLEGEGPGVDAYLEDDYQFYNFIVYVPGRITGLENKMKALIEKYKFATYGYQIIYT